MYCSTLFWKHTFQELFILDSDRFEQSEVGLSYIFRGGESTNEVGGGRIFWAGDGVDYNLQPRITVIFEKFCIDVFGAFKI